MPYLTSYIKHYQGSQLLVVLDESVNAFSQKFNHSFKSHILNNIYIRDDQGGQIGVMIMF